MFYEDIDARGIRYSATAIAADDVAVYWARVESTSPEIGGIASCPLSGCGREASTLTRTNAAIAAIALYRGTLFWTELSSSTGIGAVPSCDKDDCDSTRRDIATEQRAPVSIVASSHGLYWTVTSGLMKCATPACADRPQPLATGLAGAMGLAVDDKISGRARVQGWLNGLSGERFDGVVEVVIPHDDDESSWPARV